MAALCFFTIGCKSSTKTTVVYDQSWSSDFAAYDSRSDCSPGSREQCEQDARDREQTFTDQFSSAIQKDSFCGDINLIIYSGPKHTSEEAIKRYSKAIQDGYWALQVNFSPAESEQNWVLDRESGYKHHAAGKDSPVGLAHAICAIATGRGGSVTN